MASLHTDTTATNDENSPMYPNIKQTHIKSDQSETRQNERRETQNRPALGALSPNTKINPPAIELLKKKPMTGSPLKRSFVATVDDGQGFTYFKKRKLSGEKLSVEEISASNERERAVVPTVPTDFQRSTTMQHVETTPAVTQIDERDATPTEPNTPSDNGELQSTQSSSTERASFSSWINYDASSQHHQSTMHTQAQHLRDQREDILAKASLLKIRLQLAVYKVRTNQTSLSFDDLSEVSSEDTDNLSHQQIVKEAVAALRLEAQKTAPLHDRPMLTAQAGLAVLTDIVNKARSTRDTRFSSSPPLPRDPDEVFTPMASQEAVLKLGSPPGRAADLKKTEFTPLKDLSSSVVKGRAAEHLLGLKNAL